MKILVYNPDEKKRLVIAQLMKELGFINVSVTSTTRDFVDRLDMNDADVAFFDTHLIKKIPAAIDKILKYKSRTYCILSIDRDDVYSRTEALFKGIDDYIYNDFTLEELSAKMKAIIRVINRKYEDIDPQVLRIYDLVMDLETREVSRGGKLIELTSKEFALLEYFLKNKNRILTRTMISEKIWDIDFISESNIVDVYVTFLRNKIDKNFEPKIIKTIRGVGYSVKEEKIRKKKGN